MGERNGGIGIRRRSRENGKEKQQLETACEFVLAIAGMAREEDESANPSQFVLRSSASASASKVGKERGMERVGYVRTMNVLPVSARPTQSRNPPSNKFGGSD